MPNARVLSKDKAYEDEIASKERIGIGHVSNSKGNIVKSPEFIIEEVPMQLLLSKQSKLEIVHHIMEH